jgi:parallel beta-helix repeat protein
MRDGYRFYPEGEEYLTPTADILLEDNHFRGSRGVGVFVDAYVEDVTLRGNTVDGAGSTGIYLETGSRRNRVEGNSIIYGGYIENGPNGQLRTFNGTQIWFWGVGREGLAVDGSYENDIVGNAFYGNSNGGLFLYKNCGEYPDSGRYFERRHHADDNLIEGNTFVGGRNGVWVGSRMGENTLPMECTDPAYVESGLTRVVLDYAADNVVRANRFVDVTYGIRVEDDGTVVEGNTFESTTPGKHAVIVGTPYRTTVLGRPVDGTVLRDNTSSLAGNAFPYRWVHGHTGSTVSGNTALGAPADLCQGQEPPRQGMIFVIAAALPGPGGTAPATTPDLTVPVLGELPPCTSG